MNGEYILEMEGITKIFPGVKALDGVSFRVRPGMVHALMGENGAGKSTLMKCLFGIYKEDEGTITLEGRERNFTSPKDALESGVSMIHQELSNVPNRTVAQNLWLGREPLNKFRLVDHHKMLVDTQKLLDRLNFNIKAGTRMADLSISQQQGCEIAKAVSYNSKIVVMDEPTSSLTENEVEHLFEIIRKLKSENVAIIYISHKIEEIFQIADKVSVMRDGRMVGTFDVEGMTSDRLISLMVGRESTQRFPTFDNEVGEVSLKVENLCSPNPKSFQNVSFELHKGEVLGVGGLVGAQRTELMEAVFGLRSFCEGSVTVKGRTFGKMTPRLAIRLGVGMVTEDRRGTGIFPLLSVAKNTSMASLPKYQRFALLQHKKLRKDAEKYNAELRTKTPSMETLIQNLSGGNQQKVILAKWLMTLPDILIMDEPTRGIDVGAKFEIYTIIGTLASAGKSIIMVSSEMPELIGMSDRIMVLSNGRHTGTLEKQDINEENIMRLAAQF